ncbi:CobW family GTP-binding protein [Aquabacter spiritensis]|uniref:G3E family GTPase n=1 Tax=Aquabacter spiritensis TaxID=933073 RepID=A0A4R3LLC1_9HYPH|nr:CobW family GTP-binding protein [Aquabacter spiritensis]TCT01092.1 G3E family GTPase [Aquabacter spiritensis]
MADAGAPAIPVPVLLVTGVLGAGKTTLINSLLNADHGLALAVVVNDFGAINIDEVILSGTGHPVFGLKNGCICCSLQGDLLRTLRAILSVRAAPDAIVIEASGVSDPRGILEALFDPVLREAVRLDAVVTVIDAEDHDPDDALWRTQVRAADFVVLAKGAAIDPSALAALRATLASMHKTLVFAADRDGGVPLDLLLAGGVRHGAEGGIDPSPRLRDDRFVRLEWSSPTPISLPRFQATIQHLAPHLARAKGILCVEGPPGRTYVFQLVGRRATLTPAALPAVGAQLVLIGRSGMFDARRAAATLETMMQR